MQIADGEYEIDLLLLQHDQPNSSSLPSLVAIRYGFVPDSMDQKSPLRLYQNDQVCILEAQLVDRAGKTGVLPQSIIFEGVPQGQRLSHSASQNMDSYFLLFVPGKEGAKPSVELKRLGSVIRVSKSRNTDKWRTSIAEWKSASAKNQNQPSWGVEIPPTAPKVRTSSPALVKRKLPAKRDPPALKRPPTATPETKNDIISVSDFEDLDSSTEDAFPVFEATKEPERKIEKPAPQKNAPEKKAPERKAVDKKPANRKAPESKGRAGSKPATGADSIKTVNRAASAARPTALKIPSKTTSASKPAVTRKATQDHKPKTKAKPENEDIDMDDEFKDLEDQLQEVLDDSKSFDLDMSESDEDSDRGGGAPIVIQMNDESSSRPTSRLSASKVDKKPMSLRELYGGSKADDLSSSEEE